MDHYSFVKGSENMKILMKLYGFFIQITRMQGFVGRILLGDQIEKGLFSSDYLINAMKEEKMPSMMMDDSSDDEDISQLEDIAFEAKRIR